MLVTEFLVWSAVFALPAIAVVFAWRGFANTAGTNSRFAAVSLTLTSLTVVISEAVLAWVCFVKPIPTQDYTADELVLLLAVAAIAAGAVSLNGGSDKPRYFGLSFGAAVFMAVLHFLALLTG
jgi:hypothetical protein